MIQGHMAFLIQESGLGQQLPSAPEIKAANFLFNLLTALIGAKNHQLTLP